MSIKAVDLNYVYGNGTAFEQHALFDVNFEIRTYRFRKIHIDPAFKRTDQGQLRRFVL